MSLLPLKAKPGKTEPVPLSVPATTALDWSNTQPPFWEWMAGWQCVCQRDQNSADGVEIFPSPPPSSLHQPSRSKDSDRLIHIKGPTHLDAAYSHASERSFRSVTERYSTESEGMELIGTWQMMDGYTMAATYHNCSPFVLVINTQASRLWLIPIELQFNYFCLDELLQIRGFSLFSTVLWFE